ncbi:MULTISPECIES: DUF7507 domain-containing protein [Streptomycetaceae]|uniref:DUF7507 domain-containing protein n=1 Tax=Streptomycetaceae TaxID=2062 RepID=UPI00093BB658|nr:DUF11 domain-containing protein [Streptomyces sp. CB02056]OKI03327.1 hypothetical protein AMK13_28155 [Streptomyces sp. CB02056]
MTTNIAGPTSGYAGQEFTYTVTMSNNTLTAADGAPFTVTLPAAATHVAASCSAAAGAACPGSLAVSDSQVSGTAVSLPHLGVLTLTVTGRFGAPSPSSVTASSHIDPPPGATDSDPSSNDSSVSTTISNQMSLRVTKSQSATTILPGQPNTYTVTFGNEGRGWADGSTIRDYMSASKSLYTSYAVHIVSCDGTGGASCPSFITDTTANNSTMIFSGVIGAFPPGATLTVVMTVDPSGPVPACSSSQTADIVGNTANIFAPNGVTNTLSNQAYVSATGLTPGQCPQTNISVTKTQSNPQILPGMPNTYTVTYQNNGPIAADGATIRDYLTSLNQYFTSYAVHIVSCDGTGGVSCPSFVQDTTAGNNTMVYSGALGAFPPGAKLTIVMTVDPSGTPTTCSSNPTADIVGNTAQLFTVSPLVNTGNNTATTSATGLTPEPCPRTSISVTKTQANTVILPGKPNTYTITYENRGPNPADGSLIRDYLSSSTTLFRSYAVHIVSCDGTGGASCPSFITDTTIAYNAPVYSGTVGAFPPGARLTVVLTLDPADPTPLAACPSTATIVANNADFFVASPLVNTGNSSASTTATAPCADIAVNKAVEPAAVQAGQAVTYTIKVSNASPQTARSVEFSDPLPPATAFEYGSATCVANSAASACGPVVFDPATRTVTSTIPQISGGGDYVTITVTGTAGPVPGTYPNTATARSSTGPDAFLDAIPASNESTVSLQVFNTASTITVVKQLTGLPAGGLPSPLTFSGTVTCGTQEPQTWSVTVPAGATAATAAPLAFYDGQRCTITENPPPTPPGGLHYTGPTVINPSVIDSLGPQADQRVVSSTPLGTNAELSLSKQVDRATATTGDTVTYTYEVANTGTVPVTGVTVDESVFTGSGTKPVPICRSTDLAPAATTTCTATYTVTAQDVTAGSITNTATATATAATGPDPVSNEATATVRTVTAPGVTLAKSVTPGTVDRAGTAVSYSFTVTNTGGVPLTDVHVDETAFTGSGGAPLVDCPAAALTLAPGGSVVCTAAYTTTQADIDAGRITNAATATGRAPAGFDSPVSAEARATVTAPAAPALTLTKTAGPADTPLAEGATVTYRFLATNTGNVTLTGLDVQETAFDGHGTPPTASCPPEAGSVAPGVAIACTATYTVTAADVDAGRITNTATASATDPGGRTVRAEAATAVFPARATPALTLVKTASPAVVHQAGDTVHYTFTTTNTGNVALTDVTVTETAFDGHGTPLTPDCPPADTARLLPGGQVTCTADYTVTEDDLRENLIENTATASGHAPGGATVTSPESTAQVAVEPTGAVPPAPPTPPKPGPHHPRPHHPRPHHPGPHHPELAQSGTATVSVLGYAALILLAGTSLVLSVRRRRR